MANEGSVIHYATGEIVYVGDRVVDDVWLVIVEEIMVSPDEMASWGVHEPGLMLKTEAAGLVFEPCSSVAWDAIVFEGRRA